MIPTKLPLWPAVIFVDWHGVLSKDPFWLSILQNPRHPLSLRLTRETRELFADSTVVDSWMRGDLASPAVVAKLNVNPLKRFPPGYLLRCLQRDCNQMRVNAPLLRLLGDFSSRAFIVVATDNIDYFYEQVLRLRNRPRGPRDHRHEHHRLHDVAKSFDDILCSSQLRLLKQDRPADFFGDWLQRHGLTFQEALLLDDNPTNCAAFAHSGGTAVKVTTAALDDHCWSLRSQVDNWLTALPAQHENVAPAQFHTFIKQPSPIQLQFEFPDRSMH